MPSAVTPLAITKHHHQRPSAGHQIGVPPAAGVPSNAGPQGGPCNHNTRADRCGRGSGVCAIRPSTPGNPREGGGGGGTRPRCQGHQWSGCNVHIRLQLRLPHSLNCPLYMSAHPAHSGSMASSSPHLP